MAQRRQSTDSVAQHRVAQKYRLLGYEVEENPDSALLPEFMRGVRPDILARSKLDNVVVEVKEGSALKGSNDIVGIARRISEHPEWRFELVVLPAEKTKLDHPSSAPIMVTCLRRLNSRRMQIFRK